MDPKVIRVQTNIKDKEGKDDEGDIFGKDDVAGDLLNDMDAGDEEALANQK